jgi:hypothetical protein
MDSRIDATAARRRLRGARISLAGGLLLGMGAASASATPVISGADTDVWTIANPGPSYTVTSPTDAAVSWAIGGLLGGPVSSPATVSPTLEDGSYTLVATDQADGLTASRAFRVDLTPPKITVSQPASGAVFTLGQSVLADYACEGAVTCTGSVPSGSALDTSRAGSATLTVKAADDVGNQAVSLVDYVVKAPGTTPAVTAGGPSEPISLVPAPTTGTRKSPYRPRTLNARSLRPKAGLRIPTRTPLLRWSARRGATLYNVQIYWLHGTAATKVVSVFPRGHNVRVPAGRVAYGHTYVWRVWPYLRGHYTKRPLGLSYFTVKKPPATRR